MRATRVNVSSLLLVITLLLTGSAVPAAATETPVVQDVKRIVTVGQEVESIFDTQARTVVAPLCATDKRLLFAIVRPSTYGITSTLYSIGTTTPLFVEQRRVNLSTGEPIQISTASETQMETQTFTWTIPGTPQDVSLVYVIDENYDWQNLPTGVKYKLVLKRISNGQVTDTITDINVVPRPPSEPSIAISSPVEESRSWEGASISFACTATDPYDGVLTGTAVSWDRPSMGQFGEGQTATATDWEAGDYVVRVVATNSAWITTAATTLVRVFEQQPPYSMEITSPSSGASIPYGQSVTMSAIVSDIVDGPLTGDCLTWYSPREEAVIGTGTCTSHVFAEPLTNTIVLSAVNSAGLTGEVAITIQIQAPLPSVSMTSPPTGTWVHCLEPVQFIGSASAPPEGALTGGHLTWSSSIDGAFGYGESVATTALTTGIHTISLTAETSYGQVAVTTRALEVVVRNSWTQSNPSTSPSSRWDHTMSFDAARGETVLYGGVVYANAYSSETWAWNGTVWSLKTPNTTPGARRAHTMTYDTDRERILMFGGERDGSGVVADTWEWDGTTWTQMAPTTSPPARMWGALTYDSARHCAVLFGGIKDYSSLLSDTWTWDGTNWSEVMTSGPDARVTHGLAFLPPIGMTVLFGGANGGGPDAFPNCGDTLFFGDLWMFDGSQWYNPSNGCSPCAATCFVTERQSPKVVFDTARQALVLFGGNGTRPQDPTGQRTWNDTYAFGGFGPIGIANTVAPPPYEPYEDGPPERMWHGMAYDSARECVVLFGGYGGNGQRLQDTWELNSR